MQQNYDDAQKIIDATDIVALVSKYVKLEKQGKNYKGLCPFHNEDTPSFVVSPDKRVAHCFGCGGGGNPVKFLQQIENIEFVEALERLAEFNGMEFHGRAKKKTVDVNAKYYKIMQVATDFYKMYFESTNEGVQAKEYLIQRGLDDETIKAFHVGLSPDIGDTMYQVLKDSDFLELDMADMSLVDKGVTGYHDYFAKRIMFPICDESGRPIAFSARIFNNPDKNQPKYINSKDTKLFLKGQVLFNLNLAKSGIMKKKRVILHEGQMDVIASYRSGLEEAVCSLGTGFTDAHAKLLAKYTDTVVICYDGDKAGIKASRKAIKVFKNNGFRIYLVLLPDNMDPDEYVLKYGKEAYKAYFEGHMMDANQYIFETTLLHKNLSDSNVVSEVKNEVFALIQSLTQATEVEEYLKKFSAALGTSFTAIEQDYNSYRQTHATAQSVDLYPNPAYYPEGEMVYPDYPSYVEPEYVEPKPILATWNSICEIRLFLYAKSSKTKAMEINRLVNDYLGAFSVYSQTLWMKLIDTYYSTYEEFQEGYFIKMLENDEVEYYIRMCENQRGTVDKYDDEDMYSCIEKIKSVFLDVENQTLTERVKKTNDVSEQSRLIDEMIKNRKRKENFKKNGRK